MSIISSPRQREFKASDIKNHKFKHTGAITQPVQGFERFFFECVTVQNFRFGTMTPVGTEH